MADVPDDVFYAHLIRELGKGRLTPFLGAGVNLIGVDITHDFKPGSRLPSSSELAHHLAQEFSYPTGDKDLDLVRVAQWVFSRLGAETSTSACTTCSTTTSRPTPVHEVLARDAGVRAQPAGETEFPLVITTNYDDALERAFAARGEPFDVLTYVANRTNTIGAVPAHRHRRQAQGDQVGQRATRASTLTRALGRGEAARRGASRVLGRPGEDDSYVVTEDDYIECLTRTEIVKNLPPAVARRMHRCHYLFLGYSLRDWNLRVMLHRIWQDRAKQNNSWAVVSAPDPLEVEAWRSRRRDVRHGAGRLLPAARAGARGRDPGRGLSHVRPSSSAPPGPDGAVALPRVDALHRGRRRLLLRPRRRDRADRRQRPGAPVQRALRAERGRQELRAPGRRACVTSGGENRRRQEQYGDLETVVAYLKEWRDDPWAALAARIAAAFYEAVGTEPTCRAGDAGPGAIARLCAEHDVDLVLILDQFEEFFALPPLRGHRLRRAGRPTVRADHQDQRPHRYP